ncbi:Microtubule-nucleating Tub4p (gamma-tubulin) complex component [Umbelopsis sp. WA50703]
MNRPDAIKTFFRSSASNHGGSNSQLVDSPSSFLNQHSNFDLSGRENILSPRAGKNRTNVTATTSHGSDSTNLKVQKGLYQLVQHFMDNSNGLSSSSEVHKERAYEQCKAVLRRNPRPSVVQDEMHVANLISKKLLQNNGSSSKELRFQTLLNKLFSQDAVKNKWAALYLLKELSAQSDTQSPDSQSRQRLSSPHEIDSFASQGLPSLISPRPHTLARTHDESDSPRSTRRKVSDESDDSMAHNLPPAQQLQAGLKTHEADFSSRQIPEAALLRDMMFIFQGIDGTYIHFDSEADTYIVDDTVGIPRSTRELVHRLTELGWLYKRIQSFVASNIDDPSIGLVGQSFCSSLQRELNDYYKLIAVLEAQISKSDDNEATGSEHKNSTLSAKSLTLKRLVVWMRDSLQRLRLMSVLIDVCKDQKGGAFVSVIHNYTKHGDPFIQKFISQLLEEVSAPFWEMLQRWVYEGELEDPYEEFFVGCDDSVTEEELWQKKYTFREPMLPSFISNTLAEKIFAIGKSLNFIRYNCHEMAIIPESSQGRIQTLRYGNISAVESSIDKAYLDTSRQLLKILKDKFKLMEHLKAFKRYLLLSQGDFIQYLLDTLGKPANTLFRHNLTGVLETAIRASNAQYDDPDILARLDVRLLEISPQDLGWDVFTLDYHVDSPINTIFTPQAMQQYLQMFNFLWRLKRVEHSLSAAWRGLVTSGRQYCSIPELAKDIRGAQIVVTTMIHFTSQLQYYYLFEASIVPLDPCLIYI